MLTIVGARASNAVLVIGVEGYPDEPKPVTVDCSVVLRKGVETRFARLMDERYPVVPSPMTVLVKSDTVSPPPAVDI